MCGVISEHTKKMCTRSRRCPQHTEEQRKAVRVFLLSQGPVIGNTLSVETSDEMHIDVDTYDESDNHSLHEAIGQMWENVSSTNSSPADCSYHSNNGNRSATFSLMNIGANSCVDIRTISVIRGATQTLPGRPHEVLTGHHNHCFEHGCAQVVMFSLCSHSLLEL